MFRRMPVFTVFLSVVMFCTTGCNYFIALGYLIGGPPSTEPEFDKMTKKSMTDLDVTVAVVCYAPSDIKLDFDSVDEQVARKVAQRMSTYKIQMIRPELIFAWLDENPDWDKPEEIGEAFDATYVVYVELTSYSLYEKHSANLYRGRSEALVTVYEMDEDGYGENIFEREVKSEYPIRIARSTDEITYAGFKREYLDRLSLEIGRLFFEQYAGDDIPAAT